MSKLRIEEEAYRLCVGIMLLERYTDEGAVSLWLDQGLNLSKIE